MQACAAVLLPVLLSEMWARITINWYLSSAFYAVISLFLRNTFPDTPCDFICGLFPFSFSGWDNHPLEELENTQVSL